MKSFLLATILFIAMAVPAFATVGILDQDGNAWNNATISATVPCAASNDIYLGRVAAVSIFGTHTWSAGPGFAPEVWYSVDQSHWYNSGIPFSMPTPKDGLATFYYITVNGNPTAPWMQLRMCSAVSGLTVTVIGLHAR